jgi:hypothetical protein
MACSYSEMSCSAPAGNSEPESDEDSDEEHDETAVSNRAATARRMGLRLMTRPFSHPYLTDPEAEFSLIHQCTLDAQCREEIDTAILCEIVAIVSPPITAHMGG